ncbi:hypothetical protein DRH13_01490 [Candidatus Woesebacteria bacterium]|nr:MAG: hypothetical protein DRH13_01490 [Candidatus Woesebacteria bacterium]
MLKEKEKSHSRIITLLIECRGEKGVEYDPVFVNETAQDDTTRFIIEETGRLKKRLKDLRKNPSDKGRKEIIRKDREKVINKELLREKLSVLKGFRFQPIRLIKKGNKIQKLELGHFPDEKQKRLWALCKQKGKVSQLAKLTQEYFHGVELSSEMLDIRHRMKHGSSREFHEAKKELELFRLKAQNTPTEHDVYLVPMYKFIIEEYP